MGRGDACTVATVLKTTPEGVCFLGGGRGSRWEETIDQVFARRKE